jgi:hypothetical protein
LACEKDMEGIGVDLIDNDTFSTDKFESEINTTNAFLNRIPTSQIPQYLLGVYSDDEFGKLEASVATQLILPKVGDLYTFGVNPGVDSVIVSIPYQSTQQEDRSDGRPRFELDSIFGNSGKEFELKVYELKTYLNTLDPTDPSKTAVYYSDKEFQKAPSPFYVGNFKVNPDDTMSVIKRYLADGVTEFKKDTIKEADLKPELKIPLDKQMIRQLLVDNESDAAFNSLDNFNHYFRGLIFEASGISAESSHLMSLGMGGAEMTIYYSNDQDEEDDQDLNGNGVNGEQGVRVGKSMSYAFGTLKANTFKRDYTNSMNSGGNRLYVQGAGGSIGLLDLFENEAEIAALKSNNWLINDANLIFHVDQNASSSIVPEQLFIYDYTNNSQLSDVMTGGPGAIGGLLERDEEGRPYRYVFKITNYISELLKSDEELELIKIGLKVYNPTDSPTDITDTQIKAFSWTPKGVVLYDHSMASGDNRVHLEISYTELNNR